MKKSCLIAIGALLTLSNLLSAKVCPKCVAIETERAQEQARTGGVQNGYYDDYIRTHETALSETTAAKQKSTKYDESYNPKTGLLEEEVKDAPTPPPVKKEPEGSPELTGKKVAIALNTALSFKKGDVSNAAFISTLFDVFSIKGLFEVLEGPFTIFVPTDEAVRNYPDIQELFKAENRELLYTIVANHIVPQQLLRAEAGKIYKTLGGRNIELQSDNNEGLSVNGTPIFRGDAIGNAGVVYVINKVLIPIHQ